MSAEAIPIENEEFKPTSFDIHYFWTVGLESKSIKFNICKANKLYDS